VKLFCGMVDALVFLPPDQVQEGLQYLRWHVPDDGQGDALRDLREYFDTTYVSDSLRTIRRPGTARTVLRFRRTAPLFPVYTWNVYAETLANEQRTNNICESWNWFQQLVGNQHPSFWFAVEATQQDQAFVANELLKNSQGQPRRKRVPRDTNLLQQRLHCTVRRAFPVAAAMACNSLPSAVRDAATMSTFRQRLKTHLFQRILLTDY